MLSGIDRVQMAVADRKTAAQGWQDLLGAEHVRDDHVACLGAHRSVYQVGRSQVEFLEPDGTGVIEAALSARGRPHLFAAGIATPDFDALVAHLEAIGTPHTLEDTPEGSQAHICYQETGENDLRFVLSKTADRAPVGLIDHLYEATILEKHFQKMADAVTKLFSLQPDNYSRITSQNFKYDGTLTLFGNKELDRFEVIHPTSPETTMGRFQTHQGRAFYMCFAETPHILEIENRAKEAGAGITVARPDGRSESEVADQLWLHPSALGGVMLGISRPTMAWSWSGKPDQVAAI
ncbi:MAG: hypothetical protein COA62_07790 [Rhodobiaceae bacterium]|nr:MAG: hypothetical protein COA62_07790 [Rhodobiaceae bacterium]